MKLGGQVGCVIRTNCFGFGEDPDPDPTIFNFPLSDSLLLRDGAKHTVYGTISQKVEDEL